MLCCGACMANRMVVVPKVVPSAHRCSNTCSTKSVSGGDNTATVQTTGTVGYPANNAVEYPSPSSVRSYAAGCCYSLWNWAILQKL